MLCALSAAVQAQSPASYSELLATARPSDWRALDVGHTLVMELPKGRVVIELSSAHAPDTVANILTLVRERYFDGLSVVRSQDNYVVQWGDPDDKHPKPLKSAKPRLAPEFTRRFESAQAMPPFTRLPDKDGYAPEVGHSNGFPAARDAARNETWLAHCYGMVGVGRGNEADSGSGAQLYAVTGHAPRHLDRNITLVGRVVQGMPLLASLPRGTAPLGFYESAEERVPIRSLRLAAELPAAERPQLEVIRTDTPLWSRLVEALRNRPGPWFKVPAGHVELCNVAIAARPAPGK